MALAAVRKRELVESFRSHDKDTGSSEVQIALLSERISYLTEHQKKLLKEFDESLRKGGAKHSPSTESWTDRLKSFFGA